MNPNYENWQFEHLLNIKEQLEEDLSDDDALIQINPLLVAIDNEIKKRKYALVGEFDGKIVKEYGRWQSPEICKERAEIMGLPVEVKFNLDGRTFRTLVQQNS